MTLTRIRVNPSHLGSDPGVAVDSVGPDYYQVIKQAFGAAGVATLTDDSDGNRFPIGGAQVGLKNEAAPGSDTAAAGLNGRLQRIAQNITALESLLPAALSSLLALKTGPAESTADVVIANGAATSAAVDTAGVRNMGLYIPNTLEGISISFTVAPTLAGAYLPLRDINNVLVTVPLTADSGGVFDLPGELMFARFIKIVSDTNQTGATTLTWIFRS